MCCITFSAVHAEPINNQTPTYSTTSLVQRLVHHVVFLQKINTTLKKPIIKVDVVPSICKHELTRWCIQKIHDEQNIDALFDAWKAFSAHSVDTCTEDCLFVQDFAALIYVIYMNIIALTTRTNFQDFMTIYTQVSELPIEELLNLLDLFYQRLGIILHAYTAATSQGSIIQEYWWVPVAALAAVGTKLLHWYIQRSSQRFL